MEVLQKLRDSRRSRDESNYKEDEKTEGSRIAGFSGRQVGGGGIFVEYFHRLVHLLQLRGRAKEDSSACDLNFLCQRGNPYRALSLASFPIRDSSGRLIHGTTSLFTRILLRRRIRRSKKREHLGRMVRDSAPHSFTFSFADVETKNQRFRIITSGPAERFRSKETLAEL